MSFNSLPFLAFLPFVWVGYWLIRNRSCQNLFVIGASYVFYGWCDPRLVPLLAAMSLFGFLLRPLGRVRLVAGIAVHLAVLIFFNYTSQRFLVAVGLSFYTFQSIAYMIDVYRHRIGPAHDILAYFAYISFFPQLVAGPIERADDLMVQFVKERRFDDSLASEGVRQLLWGYFVKCAVADNCAIVANAMLDNPVENGLARAVGIIFFSIQIYADFSGYSDIAIGVSKLFGIRLKRNFRYPYFACNIADFWRRWHISLMTWFRDYVYFPLGGSRCSKAKSIRNTLVVFVLSGIWHGCGLNYLLWGVLHGLFFIPLIVSGNRKGGSRIVMLALVMLGWMFFRATSGVEAFAWLAQLADVTTWASPFPHMPHALGWAIGSAAVLFTMDCLNRHEEYGFVRLPHSRVLRYAIYYLLIWSTVFLIPDQSGGFIYFQF